MLRRIIREYLSLTSGERRGILVVTVILGIVILARILLPGRIHPVQPDPAIWETELPRPSGEPPETVRYFEFDPNQASLESLLALGLPPSTARTIINYREKGGSFNTGRDLLKIYGMHEKEYLLLEPYIRIEKEMLPDRASASGFSGRAGVPGPDSGTLILVGPGRRKDPAPFEMNSADTALLKSVYGIGPVFANRIVKYRELLGGFYSMDQLMEVYGLSEEQFAELARRSYADSTLVRTLDLNKIELTELTRHPYLDTYQAAALFSYRNTTGAFHSLQEIPDNRLLPPEVFHKIKPYLEIPD